MIFFIYNNGEGVTWSRFCWLENCGKWMTFSFFIFFVWVQWLPWKHWKIRCGYPKEWVGMVILVLLLIGMLGRELPAVRVRIILLWWSVKCMHSFSILLVYAIDLLIGYGKENYGYVKSLNNWHLKLCVRLVVGNRSRSVLKGGPHFFFT